MLQRLTDAAALALDNIRRQQTMRTVLNAAKEVNAPSGLDQTLKKISEEIQTALPELSTLTIWYQDLETERLCLGTHFGVRDRTALADEKPGDVVAEVIKANDYIEAVDASSHPIFADRPFTQREGIASTMAFPLRVEEKAIGAMFFGYRYRHEFRQDERELFPLVAEIVASTINDALQLAKTERERRRLDATLRVSEAVSAPVALDEILRTVLYELKHLYPHATPYILLYDEMEHSLVVPPNVHPEDRQPYHSFGDLSLSSSLFVCDLARHSLTSGKKDSQSISLTATDVEHSLQANTRTALGAPMVDVDEETGKHRLLGVMLLESPRIKAFTGEDEALVRAIARQTRLAIERARHGEDARYRSAIIGAIARVGPIVHETNRDIGRIRKRLTRLRRQIKESRAMQVIEEIEERVRAILEAVGGLERAKETPRPFDLEANLLNWVERAVEPRHVSVAVTAKFNLNGRRILAQPNALQRVIWDLVRNSLEAMGWESNQWIHVETGPTRDGRRAEIRISNGGSPMALDVQTRLFKEPTSTKPNDIGLARGFGALSVRALVEDMGGNVRLVSSTQEGTTVAVILPFAEEREATVQGGRS